MSDDFSARYRLLKCVLVEDGTRTHNAQELATGRVVMVHITDAAGPEEVDSQRAQLALLPAGDKNRVLETATLPSGFAVVTEFLPAAMSFRSWLNASAPPNATAAPRLDAVQPIPEPPAPVVAAIAIPPASEQPLTGSFTQLFGVPAFQASAPPTAPTPAAIDITLDTEPLTAVSNSLGRWEAVPAPAVSPPPAVPPMPPVASEPLVSTFTSGGITPSPAVNEVPPNVAVTPPAGFVAGEAPPTAALEVPPLAPARVADPMTATAAAAPPPAPPAPPAPPVRNTEPGEFTRMFAAAAPALPPQRPAGAMPAIKRPQSGQPTPPAQPAPRLEPAPSSQAFQPASAQASLRSQTPPSFQPSAAGFAEPPVPHIAPAAPHVPPRTKTPGEFTMMFGAPATAAPLPDQARPSPMSEAPPPLFSAITPDSRLESPPVEPMHRVMSGNPNYGSGINQAGQSPIAPNIVGGNLFGIGASTTPASHHPSAAPSPLFAKEKQLAGEQSAAPGILPPPIFSTGSSTPLSSLGGAAPRVNAKAGPSEYTQLIASAVAPVMPPLAPSSTAGGSTNKLNKRRLPTGLVVAINAVLLIAALLIFFVLRRPVPTMTQVLPQAPVMPNIPTAPKLNVPGK
ncbi:MAG: hypothetical protein M3Y64_02270 [Gemmatimonadota bacterium]|nr:hypothetical protein [Gemmatimonadota bacterium]